AVQRRVGGDRVATGDARARFLAQGDGAHRTRGEGCDEREQSGHAAEATGTARKPKRGWPQSFLRASPDATARGLWEDRAMGRTVLIVDDHAAFRQSASALLEAEGFHVVGQAADGADAVEQSER